MNASPKLAIAAWIGAGIVAGICIAFPCGIATGWALGAKRDGERPQGLKKIQAGPEMTWQELQDTLAANGLKTSRAKGNHGMWFEVGEKREVEVINLDAMRNAQFGEGVFLATKLESPAAAKAEMLRIKDADQRDAFAWSVFLFEGNPEMLATIKKSLP